MGGSGGRGRGPGLQERHSAGGIVSPGLLQLLVCPVTVDPSYATASLRVKNPCLLGGLPFSVLQGCARRDDQNKCMESIVSLAVMWARENAAAGAGGSWEGGELGGGVGC